MGKKTVRTWIDYILRAVMLISFLYLAFSVLFRNNNRNYSYNTGLSLLLTVAAGALFILVLFGVSKSKWLMDCTEKRSSIIFGILLIVAFPVQILFLKCFYGPVGFDVSNVVACARGGDLSAFSQYLSWYPNNHMLVAIFTVFLKIAEMLHIENIWFFLDLLNIIAIDITIYFGTKLTFLISSKKAGWTSFVCLLVFLGFSPWIAEPYSDTFCMPFMIIGLYLFIKIGKDWSSLKGILRAGYLAGMIVSIWLGSEIKPQAVIPFIAVAIISLLYVKWEEILLFIKDKRAVLHSLAGCMIGVLLVAALAVGKNQIMAEKDFEYSPNKNFTALHYMNLGMTGELGVYSSDVVWFSDSFDTVEERNEANMGEMKRKFETMGIGNYIKFVDGKIRYVTGSGLFGWYENPSFMSKAEDVFGGKLAGVIQNAFTPGNNLNIYYANMMQGVWIVTLLCMGLPILSRHKKESEYGIQIIRLSNFGLFLFTMLFEASTRYMVHAIPMFCILAVDGGDRFLTFLMRQKEI